MDDDLEPLLVPINWASYRGPGEMAAWVYSRWLSQGMPRLGPPPEVKAAPPPPPPPQLRKPDPEKHARGLALGLAAALSEELKPLRTRVEMLEGETAKLRAELGELRAERTVERTIARSAAKRAAPRAPTGPRRANGSAPDASH